MKPVNRKLSDGEIKAILQAERANALGTNLSSDLSEQRIKAFEYYMGEMTDMPVGDGESSAVSTDVQDVVEGVLPIIVDALTSGDKIVQFNPHGAGDEAASEQETDYINHVFYQENDGFLIMYTLVKDALLSKNSFVKWWMEDEEERTREPYKGLTEDAFALLTADKDVEIISSEQYATVDPITRQPMTMYDAITEAVKTKKRRKIAAVPPEEIIISKLARNIPNTPYMAHIMRRARADVKKDFPGKEELIQSAPAAISSSDNNEANVRQSVMDNQDSLNTASAANKDMELVEVAEHYIRLVMEKDGVARRYKITTVGTGYNILDIEEVTSWPFASGTSIIMPHRLIGRALADLAIDIQQIKTSLTRATLNNAYYANNQRMEVAETHASESTIDDLLNNRVGGIVRTKMPGGLNQIETQSIGHWTLPLIEYMDSVKENRTGASRYNQGLDGDSLNHTATGVTRIMDASEMRVKMMARVLAETLVVDLFRGVHQMCQEFQEEEEVVQLRGNWVTVNPREWKSRRHMTVTLPIGGASKQQLLAFFAQMLGVQKEILMQQGGPNGPLVSYQNIFAAVEQMTKLAGLKSVDPFFMKPPPPDANAPKAPDPKMVEAQSKAQVAQQQQQSDAQNAQQKLASTAQLDQLKMQMQHQREQDKFEHAQRLDKMKFDHETMMETMKAGFDMKLEAFKTQEAAKLNRQQAELSVKANVGNV